MSELSPIQKLDIVLKFLSTDRGYAELSYITKRIEKKEEYKDQFPGDDTIRILNKLIKDGYVEFDDMSIDRESVFPTQSNLIRRYWISFEGKVFIGNSGYEGLFRSKALQAQKDEAQLKRTNRNDKLLVRGTWAIALGAIALVAWEMYKYFVLQDH